MNTTHYFVNHKTRMCQVLSGRGYDLLKLISEAQSCGFVEVTPFEQDAFRADTKKALDAGWNPQGRMSYAKFVARMEPRP